MFNWLSWFDFKDCDLNYFVINWLGVEKESLLTECTDKGELETVSRYSER